MKKYKLMSVLVAIGLFAGCSQTSEPASTDTKAETQETKPLTPLQQDIQTYTNYFAPLSGDMASNLKGFEDHFQAAGKDPSLIYDKTWAKEIGDLLIEQHKLLQRAAAYTGPVPDIFQNGHRIYMQGIAEYTQFNEQLAPALIDAVGNKTDKLEEALSHFKRGGELIGEAAAALAAQK